MPQLIRFFIISLLGLFSFSGIAQNALVINEKFDKERCLNDHWKFTTQDEAQFKFTDFDDNKWLSGPTQLNEQTMIKSGFKGIGWFRLHVFFDSSLINVPIAIKMEQNIASEIYLNGVLLQKYGTVNLDESIEKRYSPENELIYFTPPYNKKVVIAVRFSNTGYEHSYNLSGEKQTWFDLCIVKSNEFTHDNNKSLFNSAAFGVGMFIFFFTLGLLHLLLFLFYKIRKSNLYYTFFSWLLSYYFLIIALKITTHNPDVSSLHSFLLMFSLPLCFSLLNLVLYSLFYENIPKQFWVFLGISLLTIITGLVFSDIGSLLVISMITVCSVESLRIILVAYRKRKRGYIIIGIGFGLFALFFITNVIIMLFTGGIKIDASGFWGLLFVIFMGLSIVSIPLSMSVFLAWDFAQLNKDLSKRLLEIAELSAKAIEQEKEKQQILSMQNEKLEELVTIRTKEIQDQKELVEQKHKEITDSIKYAHRIQKALISSELYIYKCFQRLKR